MQTGTASPGKPPAAELEAEAKGKGAAEAGEEQVREKVDSEEDGETGGRRGAAAAAVMVKRELLVRCMTCPLCRRLLREATTISECLHTCE
jgi:E3 ubiquitin-protein ligase DRIP